MSLKKLRRQVDAIDNQILRLLLRRAELVEEINLVKEKKSIEFFSPEREAEILRRLRKVKKDILSDNDIELIFKEIFSVFRALKIKIAVAYLGPEGTFTHLAAVKKFGKKVTYISSETIREVFALVEKGEANYGVVPVENTIEGVVTHTLDMFFESSLRICAEIVMEIHHDLLSYYPKGKITRIYSNPQVFAQCREWLAKNFPYVQLIPASSTAKAALQVKKDRNGACIGSRILASLYGLRIISTNIQDAPSNITRFLVISKEDSLPSGEDKTSIIFSVKDKVGALHDALYSFKKFNINLTKIESRPSKRKAWEYYFFVDFEGHRTNKKVDKSLKELEKRCNFVRVLGSYPRES
ncbi:MAG: prephenate dehydratase [Candidatus Omnitrophota bacterium]|nr:MAG: prephenate dehydratase [Candidatus Omnitrophota bacterium]